jgi:hypothetical protein
MPMEKKAFITDMLFASSLPSKYSQFRQLGGYVICVFSSLEVLAIQATWGIDRNSTPNYAYGAK